MHIDMSVLRLLESERGVSIAVLISAIEQALLVAYYKGSGVGGNARVEVDVSTGKATIWVKEFAADGSFLQEYDDTPVGFGRIASSTARQVIMQRLRDADDMQVVGNFKAKEGEIVSGVVQQGNKSSMVQIDLGSVEGLLPPPEQVAGEVYKHGERLRVYVVDVRRGDKGSSIILSRSHPMLVRKLFELEVPEIANGLVEIVALSREAGHRTKIAVCSKSVDFNAKGACIGEMGSRVRAVQDELGGEKIDIVDFDEDPKVFIANSLSPALVSSVSVVDLFGKVAKVVVPDYQLSLAIGKEGQNARLAARLTGWKIDIVSDMV